MIEPIHPDLWIEQRASLVYQTCRQNTSSEDSAWEAFQETFLAYMRRRNELGLESDHTPWLYETARRCSLAVVRKERRLPVTGLPDIEAVIPPINALQVDSAFLAEAVAILRDEVGRLPDEDQKLLRFLYVDGTTHREVAGRLNCAAGSIHARAEQARNRLRQRMERRGIVVGALLLLFLLQANAEGRDLPSPFTPQPSAWRPQSGWLVSTIIVGTIITTFFGIELSWNLVSTQIYGNTTSTLRSSNVGGGCSTTRAQGEATNAVEKDSTTSDEHSGPPSVADL